MTLANAHALFNGLNKDPSYLASLEVSEAEKRKLMQARTKVRDCLKQTALSISDLDQYWDFTYAQKIKRKDRGKVSVKFMMQGSFAYKTLNSPAQSPQQEIDLDDGMYIPVTFLENGNPALIAGEIFRFVDEALEALCARENWVLDPTKNNCARVKLWPGAHIDIPIYSIPIDRYEDIAFAMKEARSYTFDSLVEPAKLPSDKIMLAQRDGQWILSDPQQLHDWVKGRKDFHGPVFKRLCRFLKGWRDHTWLKSPLSSLCIMCAVDVALRQIDGYPTENRDDEMILEVVSRLPEVFEEDVINPVIEGSVLNDWNVPDKLAIISATRELIDHMDTALNKTGHADIVVKRIQVAFGERVPYRPDIVKIRDEISSIQKATPSVVAAPVVISSTSG